MVKKWVYILWILNFLNSSWLLANENMSVGGLVEIELHSVLGKSSSEDIYLRTAQIDFNMKFSSGLESQMIMLYEEKKSNQITVDSAFLLQNWSYGFLLAGKNIVPFGHFNSHMLSESLTLKLGETRDIMIQAGLFGDLLNVSFFAANSDIKKKGDRDKINSFGLNLGLDFKFNKMNFITEFSFTNNLLGSDLIKSIGVLDISKSVSAFNLFFEFHWKKSGFIVEYLSALEKAEMSKFDWNNNRGAKFSAFNIEMFHLIPIFSREFELGYGHQFTSESLALKLPKSKALMFISTEFASGSSLGLEYARIKEYSITESSRGSFGSGDETNEFLVKWSAQF